MWFAAALILAAVVVPTASSTTEVTSDPAPAPLTLTEDTFINLFNEKRSDLALTLAEPTDPFQIFDATLAHPDTQKLKDSIPVALKGDLATAVHNAIETALTKVTENQGNNVKLSAPSLIIFKWNGPRTSEQLKDVNRATCYVAGGKVLGDYPESWTCDEACPDPHKFVRQGGEGDAAVGLNTDCVRRRAFRVYHMSKVLSFPLPTEKPAAPEGDQQMPDALFNALKVTGMTFKKGELLKAFNDALATPDS